MDTAANQAILEHIYPTEYVAPKGPDKYIASPNQNNENKLDPAAEAPEFNEANRQDLQIDGTFAPALPTAYETRNLGETVEINAVLSEDSETCDIRFAGEQVLLASYETYGKGVSESVMPIMETRRFTTSCVATIGKPYLLGSMNRPSDSDIDPDSRGRVSYAFLTVRLR